MTPGMLIPRHLADTARLLAQTETQSFRATELDLPESTGGILLMLAGLVVLFGLAFRTSLRDSRFLKAPWRVALLLPRLIVLLLVAAILLNPRQRTQISRIERSQVGILLDTSLSMAWPAEDQSASGSPSMAGSAVTPATTGGTVAAPPLRTSRADAVKQQLLDSGLLAQLARTHQVSIYGFDSALAGPLVTLSGDEVRFSEPSTAAGSPGESTSPPEPPRKSTVAVDTREQTSAVLIQDPSTIDRLESLMLPTGGESRLGEALHQLIGQVSSRSLSGLVVISDGRLNAGLGVEPARLRAERSGTRLIAVGVGSEKPQVNLWVAGIQSPTDVHKGDPFDLTVIVQGSGAAGRQAIVRLFQQSAGSDGKDQKQVAEQTVELTSDALPVNVRFTQQLSVPGRFEYVARVESASDGTAELSLNDNERRRQIEVTDRRIRVLVISSGPMRDYQFVRNTLYRHSGIESDVWLQTVTEEDVAFVSQEARQLLTRFPSTEAALFEYDVIVAFDPDWSRLTTDERQYLNRWVSEHSGGLIVVAGEIFTPELAQAGDGYRDISVLYPVLLNRMVPELQLTQRADQPWPVTMTPEGRSAEFLRIADATGNASSDLWQSFRGIYRSYPIRALRDGAVALLEYGNPRARTEIGQPPFLASQFYGTGRTVFIGSAETWRLREISPQAHQRFWTSLIREAGQGRRSRGTARGLLLLDRTEAVPGQAVNIRAQLYDARLQPLQTESVAVSVVDAEGRPVTVPDRLISDGRGTGQYVSNFRPSRPGAWRISVPVPESGDVLQETIEVVLPNLESQNPAQNVALLTSLTEGTDGAYLPLAQLTGKLPELLPDRSEPVIIDEQLRTLWDRQWLMYLLIGLLAVEWGLRRVVRLS